MLCLFWRLETSSRPVKDFGEMAVYWDLLIFSWWCLLFWRSYIRKNLDLGPSPPNHAKCFVKILSTAVSLAQVSCPSYIRFKGYIKNIYSLQVLISIIILKLNCNNSYNNTHHGLTILGLMAWFVIQKIEYLKNGTWLFIHEIKKLLSCVLKTTYPSCNLF